jgi:murein L,D-transpeptidase YafK
MKRNILFITFLALIATCISPAHAREQVARVLVTKSDRSLYLFDAQGNVMRSYKISLGFNPVGQKMQEGDGRTPEGRYVIDRRNENSEYYLSLHLTYPNAADLARAKKNKKNPGGGLFIHGQPNGKEWQSWKYGSAHDWTFGCIAVENREIREIWDSVPNGTPVVIVP